MFTDFDFQQEKVRVQLSNGMYHLQGWLNLDQGPSYKDGEQNVLWTYEFGTSAFEDNSIDIVVMTHSLMYINRGEIEKQFQCY